MCEAEFYLATASYVYVFLKTLPWCLRLLVQCILCLYSTAGEQTQAFTCLCVCLEIISKGF